MKTDYSPPVSIILPVFNGEDFLEDAIISVVKQSYRDFELILVDDCSTDSTPVISKKWYSKYHWIKYHRNSENLKLPMSLNVGHALARGNYLTWVSHDNILAEDFLKILVSNIEKTGSDLCFSNQYMIDKNGNHLYEYQTGPAEGLIFGNNIGLSFLYKKNVFDYLNGYDENLFLVEDYDFFLRASLKFKFSHIDQYLYSFRLSEDSLTGMIKNKGDYRHLYYENIEKIIKRTQETLDLSEFSTKFLRGCHSQTVFDIKWLDENFKYILSDIFKISLQSSLVSNILQEQFYLAVRNILFKYTLSYNSKFHYVKFILKHPQIIFSKNYSKKKTLRLIFKIFK